jgi:hypothetical protein
MRHQDSSAVWLRILRSNCLAADRFDDRSHSSPEVSSAVRVSRKQKQTFRSPEHCDRLLPGVFHVENALQTRWRDPAVVLKHPSRRQDSETKIARCCAGLLRRDSSNKFVALVALVQRTAAGDN